MVAASDGHNRRRWPLLAGWLGLLFCCALLWGSEWALQYRQRRAEAEGRVRRATFAFLADLLSHSFGSPPETFEADLNQGRPLRRLSGPGDDPTRAEWDAAAVGPECTGWTVQLTFRQPTPGRDSSGGLVSARTNAPPPRFGGGPTYATLLAMEKTRHAALLGGAGIWFLGFLTILFARPWRRQIARASLAGALLAAVAWAVGPTRVWDRVDLLAPLPFALAGGILLSLIARVAPARRPAFTPGQAPCAGCGYDLTGNQSGVCPECGRITPRGRVDRWRETAERITHVETGEPNGEEGSDPAPVEEEVDEVATGRGKSQTPDVPNGPPEVDFTADRASVPGR